MLLYMLKERLTSWMYVIYSHLFAMCTCLLLFWFQTQNELVALKKKNEMAENELRASRTRNQQLATKNEEMAVSYSTFITITHATIWYVCDSINKH